MKTFKEFLITEAKFIRSTEHNAAVKEVTKLENELRKLNAKLRKTFNKSVDDFVKSKQKGKPLLINGRQVKGDIINLLKPKLDKDLNKNVENFEKETTVIFTKFRAKWDEK